MRKLLILSGIFMIISLPLALAQAGLFSSEGGTSFATFGILAVIAFFVVSEIVKHFKRKK